MRDLPLQWKERFQESCFVSGSSNQEAYHWINAPSWPFSHLWLYGPKGCGKSHMGSIWSEKHRATIVTAPTWPENPLPPFLWIDFHDQDMLGCEIRLFSFLQRIHDNQCHSLWTSRHPIHHFDFSLKDVGSRMKSMMCVHVMRPDDVLFAKVLAKSFQDIGWTLSDKKLCFLTTRMPRSFESIAWAIDFVRQNTLSESLSFHALNHLVSYLDQKTKIAHPKKDVVQ